MREVPVIEAVIVIIICSALSVLLTSLIIRKVTSDDWMDRAVKAGKGIDEVELLRKLEALKQTGKADWL